MNHNLTPSQRAADAVTEFCGSWAFITVFSAITFVWMASSRGFDPYPFILLNLMLTVVSTFQSPLIMMSQNRQIERDREAIRGLHDKLDALAKQNRQIEKDIQDLRRLHQKVDEIARSLERGDGR